MENNEEFVTTLDMLKGLPLDKREEYLRFYITTEHPFEEFAERGEVDQGDPFEEFSDKDKEPFSEYEQNGKDE